MIPTNDPFDALSINWMLAQDMHTEGVNALPHFLPDARAGAFSVIRGKRSPGSNVADPFHQMHPGRPVIGFGITHFGPGRVIS